MWVCVSVQDCLFQYLNGRYRIQDITAQVVFDYLTSLIEHHSQYTVHDPPHTHTHTTQFEVVLYVWL